MRISERLFLAVVPSVVGVFTVAGLAYWGAYHRAAPEWVVVVAAVSAVGSLILAWQNTRYVAHRIGRLAGERMPRTSPAVSPLSAVRDAALPGQQTVPDEIDSIEEILDHLNSAVAVAQAGGEARERAATERVREYAVLLDEASAAVRRQLDETRLALHILGENHFGVLNENQEEMLAAARTGAEAAATEMARLHEIAQLDRGALHSRRDAIQLADVLRSLRPQLEAEGASAGVSVTVDLAPGLPKVLGDRARLSRALELLLRHLVRHATPGAALSVETAQEPGGLILRVSGAQPLALDADIGLARRIIEAHGGRIESGQAVTTVLLPTPNTVR